MESTKENRVWRSGPPPHVGWWNAGAIRHQDWWSWWDGAFWSVPVSPDNHARAAAACATLPLATQGHINWNDYWPADARVPRLAPEDFEVGARWVLTRSEPLAFKGQEFTVRSWDAIGLELHSHGLGVFINPKDLPSERFVPRRCIGPQTRWDFPVLRADRCLETVLDNVRGAGVQVVAHSGYQCEALEVKPTPRLKEPPIGSRWEHRRRPGLVWEVLAVTDLSEIVGRLRNRMEDYVLLRVVGTYRIQCTRLTTFRRFAKPAN